MPRQRNRKTDRGPPGIVGEAFPKAAIPANIIAAFKVSGVWPFNRDIFRDDEFAPTSVTDRPLAFPNVNMKEQNEIVKEIRHVDDLAIPGPSTRPDLPSSDDDNLDESFRVLENIRPLPKAAGGLKKATKRRKKHSAILTDTLEKQLLEKEQNSRKEKQR